MERLIRKNSCHLLELVDEGTLNAAVALEAALMHMSEKQVTEMININQFFNTNTLE